jgi:Ca2+-binding EF-hand superfamily protein
MAIRPLALAAACSLLAGAASGAPPAENGLEGALSSEERSQLRRDLDAWAPELYRDRPARGERLRRAAEALRERFREADADADGMLDRQEFAQFAPRQLHRFDAIDANRDGRVDPDEVRLAIRERIERRVERRLENGQPRR